MNFTIHATVGGRRVATGHAYTFADALAAFQKELAEYQRQLGIKATATERALTEAAAA